MIVIITIAITTIVNIVLVICVCLFVIVCICARACVCLCVCAHTLCVGMCARVRAFWRSCVRVFLSIFAVLLFFSFIFTEVSIFSSLHYLGLPSYLSV